MSYNYKVMELVSKLEYLTVEFTESWVVLHKYRDERGYDHFVERKAADSFAHFFADRLLRGGYMEKERHEEHDGLSFRFRTYAFTREQLIALLEETYQEGQKSATQPKLELS